MNGETWKTLRRSMRLAVADRPPVGVREQVVVALTEGVVHFGEDGEQFTARSWQNHRLIGLKTKPRTRGKHCSQTSPSALDAFALQQLAYPGQRMRTVAGTMIGEMEAEEIPAIDREQRTARAARCAESGSRQK
jgi:hypothetical protein